MASPPLDIHCDAPDPAVQPQTFTEACAIIDELLRGEIVGADAYLPYVVSNTTPGVDDQDKIWIQLDGSGRPIAIKKYYSGNWRAVYTGQPSEVKMFTGDPAPYFDTTGRGKIGLQWDGWAICNGQNGTPNWTDRLVFGAHMDGSGGMAQFASGWQTGVSGSATKSGGGHVGLLTPNQIPWPATPPVVVDLYAATGDTPSVTGALFGKHHGETAPTGTYELIPANPGNIPADSWSVLNPYVTAAFVMFIGYL